MMGTGPFAVPTYRWLLESKHPVAALFTRPPREVHTRKKTTARNPMQQLAEQHGQPVFMPESINAPEAIADLRSLRPDLLVVCDYGQILSSEVLSAAPLGGINLHGSLLPKYRGAAPVAWAVYHGETETGVTVIHMTPRLDAGPAIAKRSTPIGERETTAELEPRLAEIGVQAVHEAIEKLSTAQPGQPIGEVQDPSEVTKAPRLKKSDGRVDWTRTAREIDNQVRAFKPWPGTFTEWERQPGKPIRLLLDWVEMIDEAPCEAPPGHVVDATKSHIWVATGRGTLSLQRLQPAGKKVQTAEEFQRGYQLGVGQRLVS